MPLPPPDAETLQAIDAYLDRLRQHGAITPQVIAAPPTPDAWAQLSALPSVSLDAALVAFYQRFNGCDATKAPECDVFEPEVAWWMHAPALHDAIGHYQPDSHTCTREDGDVGAMNYWPDGFVPLLWDGSGDHLLYNALATSPTRGAVYYLRWAFGCVQLAPSLKAFFDGCSRAIDLGIWTVDESNPAGIAWHSDDLQQAFIPAFGDTPYFQWMRAEDSARWIDWKPDVAPYLHVDAG